MQHQTPSPHPRAHPAHTSSPHPRSNGGMVDTKDLKSFGHSGRAGSSPASSTPTPPRPRVRSPHPPIPDPGPAHTPTYPRSGAYPYPHLFPDPRSRAYHLRLFSSPQKKPHRATHSRATSNRRANYPIIRLLPPEDLFGLECDVIGAWVHEFEFKCTRESFVKRVGCVET